MLLKSLLYCICMKKLRRLFFGKKKQIEALKMQIRYLQEINVKLETKCSSLKKHNSSLRKQVTDLRGY